MKTRSLLAFAAAALGAQMGAALRADADGAPSPATTIPNENMAIYVGLGGLNGPGRVVQLDWKAGVLGAVELPAAPASIACTNDELIAGLRFHSAAVFIDRDGGTGTIFDARQHVKSFGLSVSGVAAHPKTGDLVFSAFGARRANANEWNAALVVVPATARQSPRTIFLNAEATSVPASDPDFPCIRSMAVTPEGQMLMEVGRFNGRGEAVYRFPFGKNVVFDKPFMTVEGQVTADPSSERWAVLESRTSSQPKIRLYQDAREIKTLSTVLESGVRSARIAFAPNGSLIYVRDTVQKDDVPTDGKELHTIGLYLVDIDGGSFRKLGEYLHESTTKRFYQTGLDSIAIGKKLPWRVADSTPGAAPEKGTEKKGAEQ